MSKRLTLLSISLALAALVGVLAIVKAPSASALSGNEFQAGRIIDDGFFFNKNTMNISAIQGFLNAKVPSCDTNGTQAYGGTTRAAHGASRGYPPPFTCLKDYRQDTPVKNAENGLCGYYGGGNNSAAEIIYHVSQTCGINPQVLLVLLQKEQSLITDDWPWSIQYRSATGYGCPDTAACDSTYYGFFNQVYAAARQFKRYARDAHVFNYRAGATTFIQYSPNASCGGTNIFIQNQATANLYNYTPYQPNASALGNLYGTGDNCGAYGNRNFWRMWRDWFGPIMGVDYSWQYDGITFSTGTSSVVGNSKVTITVSAKNTGNQSWSNANYPVRLATFAPSNHNSPLYDGTWINPSRLATLNQAVVLPGETGTFTFVANIPNINGGYYERFNLVAEGATWFQDPDFSIQMNISKTNYRWQMVSQSSNNGFELTPGQTAQFTLVAKNTGNTTWNNSANPVRLATWYPTNRNSPFYDASWPSSNRLATLQESSVAPGQNGTFVFTVKAPSSPGSFIERYNLVMEGISWFEDPWLEFQVNVGDFHKWRMVSQSSSTNSFTLARNASATFTLVAQNTGNVTWSKTTNPVRLATWYPTNRNSSFYDASWPGSNRVALLQESSVAPGQNGTFVFTVKAPGTPGFYIERFNLVREGISWFTDPWLEFQILVN